MALDLHTVSVGTYLQILPPVAALVDKAEAFCREKGHGAEALCDARLAPDMWSFAKQVTSVAHHSAGTMQGLLGDGTFGPDFAPPPSDFAALRGRLTDAIAYLEGLEPDVVNGKAGADMAFVFGERRMPFTAEDFILTFSLPNFYFHASTAYGVLRNQGLAIGKMDFLGSLRMKG
jgi:uncharacterized protein